MPKMKKEYEECDDLGYIDRDDMKKQDKGFFGHGTHESMQEQEESVHTFGDGFSDSSVPKKPTTDSFYHNVSNWKR